MYGANIANTDDFILFEIVDESGAKIDSVSITKHSPETVLYFYGSDTDYIEEYENKMRDLVSFYEDKINFDEVINKRSEAEFILYKSVKGLE